MTQSLSSERKSFHRSSRAPVIPLRGREAGPERVAHRAGLGVGGGPVPVSRFSLWSQSPKGCNKKTALASARPQPDPSLSLWVTL